MNEENKKILCNIQRLCISREYCEFDIRKKIMTRLQKINNQGPNNKGANNQGANNLRKNDIETSDRNINILSATEEILDSLIKDKFVDNQRYANAYAKDKAILSGWGANKIRAYLKRKEISNEVINNALEEIDQKKANEKMEKAITHKFHSVKDSLSKHNEYNKYDEHDEHEHDEHEHDEYNNYRITSEIKLKVLRFAAGRGYSYDESMKIINKLLNE